MSIRSTIITQMQQIADEQDKKLTPLTDDLELVATGLDSIGFAILVARLEDLLGTDPFTNPDMAFYPVTFGHFVGLYEDAAKAA